MARGVRRSQNLTRVGPISPVDLASDLGLEVLFQDLREVEGLYLPRGSALDSGVCKTSASQAIVYVCPRNRTPHRWPRYGS